MWNSNIECGIYFGVCPLPTISQCQKTCDDFGEGLCNFSGNSMIGTLSTTDVQLCQTACRWDVGGMKQF